MNEKTRTSGDAVVRGFNLRPVQVAALDGVAQHWRNLDGGDRRALVILPTGVGKTITALEACRRAAEKGVRILWLAHRDELVLQPFRAIGQIEHFSSLHAVAGVVKDDRNDADAQVVFSSVQTMDHRSQAYLSHGRPGLVVVDEAHHYAPGSHWYTVVLRLIGAEEDGSGGCHVIGLTATPQRGDNVKLSPMWGMHPAFFFGLSEAMREGYLLQPEFLPAPLEMSEELAQAMETANADGATDCAKKLAKQLLDEGIAEHTADVLASLHEERSRHALVYCASIKQVEQTTEELGARGLRVAMVTGKTPKALRRDILDRFQRAEFDALVNCDVLTEGTDLPIADTIVLARPCGSKALYIQIVGRGARLYPGQPSFTVVDILGASDVHSLEQAPVLDVGEDEVGRSKAGDSDMTIAAIDSHEDEHVFAPMRSLWTADVIEVHQEEDDKGRHFVGSVRLRSPFQTSIGGRTLGRFQGDERQQREAMREGVVVQVGRPGPWRVYHAVRVPRFSRVEQWAPAWVKVAEGIIGVDMADSGCVILIQELEGVQWWPVLIKKGGRKVYPLSGSALDLSIAEMVVRDLVRRASKDGKESAGLVKAGASWRGQPPSAAQVAMLERVGVTDRPETKGEATEMITREKLATKVKRYGLLPGWTPRDAQ